MDRIIGSARPLRELQPHEGVGAQAQHLEHDFRTRPRMEKVSPVDLSHREPTMYGLPGVANLADTTHCPKARRSSWTCLNPAGNSSLYSECCIIFCTVSTGGLNDRVRVLTMHPVLGSPKKHRSPLHHNILVLISSIIMLLYRTTSYGGRLWVYRHQCQYSTRCRHSTRNGRSSYPLAVRKSCFWYIPTRYE